MQKLNLKIDHQKKVRASEFKDAQNQETQRKNLQEQFQHKDPKEILQSLTKQFKTEELILTVGFGAAGMVLLHIIAQNNIPIPIVTIDTGRLPEQTYELIERIQGRYPQIKIQTVFPEREDIEKLTSSEGHFSFRESVEKRKFCCRVRKVKPLKRALVNKKLWVSGVHKDQSVTRKNAKCVEITNHLTEKTIFKVNPLVNWTEEMIWDYIKKHKVPYNKLYDQKYLSIGCAPCTRPVKFGEGLRAGRWWWEHPESKECGIHDYK